MGVHHDRMKTALLGAGLTALCLSGCTLAPQVKGPPSAASTAETPGASPQKTSVSPVALRSYAPEQIVQVLRGLRDDKGAAPSLILDDLSIKEQAAGSASAQAAMFKKMQLLPERCAPLLNLDSAVTADATRGFGAVALDGALFASVGIIVDPTGGNQKRNAESKALLEDCGEITVRSGGTDTSMSTTSIPVEVAAEESFAFRASTDVASGMKMIAVTAITGSVMINAVALSYDVLLADFDETVAAKALAGFTQQALDKFAELPEEQRPVRRGP